MTPQELNTVLKNIPAPVAVFKVMIVPKWAQSKVFKLNQYDHVFYDTASGGYRHTTNDLVYNLPAESLHFIGYQHRD